MCKLCCSRQHRTPGYLIEPLLFFAAFFLPGYISQGRPISPDLFNSINFNLVYISSSIPQILLLFYVMLVGFLPEIEKLSSTRGGVLEGTHGEKKNDNRTMQEPIHSSQVFKRADAKLSFYDIQAFKVGDIPSSIVAAAGIYLLVLFISLISTQFSGEYSEALKNPVTWKIENPLMLPLVFLTCIVTGYREEIFFRAYFIRRFEISGFYPAVGVAVTTVLFSVGHLYQGFAGLVGTLLIGLYFGFLFLRFRNIHMIAIAHAIFNFLNLLFASL
jgi:hypothetical protein